MLYIIIAICAGASVTISRMINSNLADEIGIFQGTYYNYLVGLIVSTILLVFSKTFIITFSSTLSLVPPWAFTGGLLGVIVVALSSYVTPKISVFYITIIMFIGQLFTGSLIDYYTLNILSVGKLIGGLFVLAGLIINVLIDKKELTKNKTGVSSSI